MPLEPDSGRLRAAVLIALLLGAAIPPASAQSSATAPSPSPPAGSTQPSVDVSRLPISLQRIHRELQQTIVRQESDGLRLRVEVDVFGQAPPLSVTVFTAEDNLLTGPVPFGAPTHRELVDHVTPREFRTPAADLGALFRWLAEKAK
jgi:hypothetical protein